MFVKNIEMLNKYSLTISFNSLEELQAFCNKFETEKVKEVLEKKEDLRGSKTKDLHKLTREIKAQNESLSYKACLKLAGKQIKNKE